MSLDYGGQNVRSELWFSVKRGETVAVLGISGCSKMTMLNIVARFPQPTAEIALISGREISGPGPDRGFGFIVLDAASFFRTTFVFAGGILIGIVGLARDRGLAWLSRRWVHWEGRR